MRYLSVFFFFSLYLFSFDYHLKPYKISNGIHCFFGLPSQVNHINGGNMINSCYIETKEGYVVIDSGPTYNYAQDAYTIMEKQKKLPVKYVINTSSDEVHILGNEFYKEQGAILLGPTSYKELISNKRPLVLEKLLSEDAIFNTRIIPLDSYLKSNRNLFLGDLNLKINVIENDADHLYVYIKEKKIVFAGDMVYNNRMIPLKNKRSLLIWEKALEGIAKLEWVDIVSAHGYMTRRSALNKTKEYLELLKSSILKRIKNGESRQEIISNVKLSTFSHDRLYSKWHSQNVATAYDELVVMLTNEVKVESDAVLVKTVSKEMKKIEKPKRDTSEKIKLIKKPKPKPKSKVLNKTYSVKYKKFSVAMQRAKAKNKIVLIKVRSTTCKYCDQLDRVISHNTKVKKILNKYFEVVKINTDHQDIPLELEVRSTPTLIFIQPNNKKVLMKLPGIRALGELLEILNEAVEDGHNGGYLRP